MQGNRKRDAYFLLGIYSYYAFLSFFFIFRTNTLPVHDNLFHHLPLFDIVLTSLNRFKEIPLWLPQISGGLPGILFINNFFLLLLTRYPFYLFAFLTQGPIDSLFLYKLNSVFTNILFSFSFYLLLRELFPRRAVVYWGVLLALMSGVSTGTLAQEQLSASIFYLPLLLFLSIRFFRTGKISYCILLGLFLGQALCNHYPHLIAYVLFIFSLLTILLFPEVRKVLAADKLFWAKRFFGVLLPLAFLVMSPVLFGFHHYHSQLGSTRRTIGIGADYEEIVSARDTNSLSPQTLLFYGWPYAMFDRHSSPQTPVDRTPYYVGLLGLIFFLWALLKPTRTKVFWLGSITLIFLFAEGDRSFVYPFLFRYVPLASLQRIPIHMGNFMNLGIILLSCIGFSEALEHFRERARPLAVLLFCILLLDLTSFFGLVTRHCFVRAPLKFEAPMEYLSGFIHLNQESIPEKTILYSNPPPRLDMNWERNSFGFYASHSTAVPLNYSFNGVQIRVSSSAKDLFAFDTNYDVYWESKVDGVPVPTLRVGDTPGIFLPAGEHSVSMSYQPTLARLLVYLHVVLTAFSVVLLFLTLLPILTARMGKPANIPIEICQRLRIYLCRSESNS